MSDIDYDVFDVEHPNGVLPYRGRSALSQHVTNLIQTNDISFIASSGNYATSHFRGTFNPDANGFHRFNYGTSELFGWGTGELCGLSFREEPAGGSQTDLELIVADNNTWNSPQPIFPRPLSLDGRRHQRYRAKCHHRETLLRKWGYTETLTIPAVYRFAVWDREHGKRPTSNVEFEAFVVTRPVDNVIKQSLLRVICGFL